MINRANKTEIITKDDIKNTEATLSDLLNVSSDVCGDDEIVMLDLPVRSKKRIAGIGIRYIKELLSIKLGRLLAIGGMGLGSLNDIAGAIAKRISEASRDEGDGCEGMLDTYFALNTEAECNEPSRPVCIEELGLTVRSYNCLKRSGITVVSDLEKLSRDELLSIKNLGASSADEILNVLKDLEPREKREKRLKAEMEERERQEECSALASELFAAYGGVPADWSSMIRECIKNEPNIGIGGAVIRLYEQTELFDHLRNLLLNLVEAHQDKLDVDELTNLLPKHLQGTDLADKAVDSLKADGAVEVEDGMITRIYPSISEYVGQIEDERMRSVLSLKLEGLTLEQIGERIGGVTRERVRQILNKALKQLPRLREDRYLYMFGNYSFSYEDLNIEFGEPEYVFNYLDLAAGTKAAERRPLSEALEDENIKEEDRRNIERAVFKNSVMLDGVRVEKVRPELVKRFIKSRCKEDTHIDDLAGSFNAAMAELGITDERLFLPETNTVENHLQIADYVLWKNGRSFRAYDIESKDIDRLWSELNLEQYEGLEISALMLLRSEPELMREFDIRDEYELHNLLKKTAAGRIRGLSFGRMPMLSVGSASRTEQMRELLVENAPIEADTLCGLYEELYGMKAEVIKAHYQKEFDRYYHNGLFTFDAVRMPPDVLIGMKKLLPDDFYTIAEIKSIFRREFPEESPEEINAYNLKELGFAVYSGYVIVNSYSNAREYFRAVLTENEITDLTGEWERFGRFPTFSQEVYALEDLRTITEYEPNRFIGIGKLNEMGVTKEDLDDFCRSVRDHAGRGEYFTVKSLLGSGFDSPLVHSGLGEYFLSSVLASGEEGFPYQRMGGVKLFCSSGERPSLPAFLRSIVRGHGSILIADLENLLRDEYGIELPPYKLTELIKESGTGYDPITRTAFDASR